MIPEPVMGACLLVGVVLAAVLYIRYDRVKRERMAAVRAQLRRVRRYTAL